MANEAWDGRARQTCGAGGHERFLRLSYLCKNFEERKSGGVAREIREGYRNIRACKVLYI